MGILFIASWGSTDDNQDLQLAFEAMYLQLNHVKLS